MTPERARLATSLVDLTDLSDDASTASTDELCERALKHGTAAVCVWPDFVARAAARLDGSMVSVATVVNFPTGDERPFAVGVLTERVVADGADDVDVVIPYRSFLAGDTARSAAVLDVVRSATEGRAIMKAILETGELADVDTIERAAETAIACGADFVKTSTGKSPVSATPDAASAMLRAVARADRPVGLKPSGGIRTVGDAERYMTLAETVIGDLRPQNFRFGASGLLDALTAAVEGDGDVAGDAAY